MKKIVLLLVTLAFASSLLTSCASEEKQPVQHLKMADVSSIEDAKKIFTEKTSEINSKKNLDVAELQQIHVITYSLEKSIAYFAENLNSERRELAKEIAVVVEDIHLSSENNQKENTQEHLTKYFKLAEKFISGF